MYHMLWHLHNQKLGYTCGTRETFPVVKISKASPGGFYLEVQRTSPRSSRFLHLGSTWKKPERRVGSAAPCTAGELLSGPWSRWNQRCRTRCLHLPEVWLFATRWDDLMEGINSAQKDRLSCKHRHWHQLFSFSFVRDSRLGAQNLSIFCSTRLPSSCWVPSPASLPGPSERDGSYPFSLPSAGGKNSRLQPKFVFFF